MNDGRDLWVGNEGLDFHFLFTNKGRKEVARLLWFLFSCHFLRAVAAFRSFLGWSGSWLLASVVL